MYREAAEAGKNALSLAGSNRSYYKEQLTKFNNAAGE
jgi:hypothetical protein